MKKFDGYFQVTIALDISYYVKLNGLSIKIIFKTLTLLVLQITAVLGVQHISRDFTRANMPNIDDITA